MARLARAAAQSLGTESGTSLSPALGSPPRSRGTPRQPAVILTGREWLMLRYLPSHLTNAKIASECLISVSTVKAHLKNIGEGSRGRALGVKAYRGSLGILEAAGRVRGC